MHYLALSIPGANNTVMQIQAPATVPTGGLSKASQIIGVGITMFIILVAVFCLFTLVFAGIQWTTSGGDKQKVTAARSRITFAIIGLMVALSSFFLIDLLGGFFGIKLLGA